MLFVRVLGPAFAVVLAGCAAIPELEFDDDAGDAAALSFAHPDPVDAGTAHEEDAGVDHDAEPITAESDDASLAEDASRAPPPPAVDAAPPFVDAAPPPPPATDAAPPMIDAALPPADAAPPPADAAPPPADAAPPPFDASPPPPPTSCPWATPAGADACCGIVPCVGKKCATHCLVCIGCLGGACCLSSNGKTATCAASPNTCPHPHK